MELSNVKAGSVLRDPDRIRTYDLQLRKLTLYPTELRGREALNRYIRTFTKSSKTPAPHHAMWVDMRFRKDGP